MMSAYSLPTNRQAGTRLRAPGGRGLSARAGYTCLRVLAGTLLLFLSACGGGKTPAAPSVPNQVPAFTAPPSDTTVVAGAVATFTAVASGHPDPTFHWERSGLGGWSAVSGATGKTFTFTAQAVDNGATFRAVATNSQGTATSKVATLSVNAPPTISAAPADRTVSAGDLLSFTVTATATITALDAYDNISTAFAGQVSFSSSDTFALLPTPQNLPQGVGSFPVTLKSSGTQSLTTTSGTLSTSLSGITVQYTAPTFSVQPADLSADPNIPISLPATATGLPAPEITWESSRDGITWIAISGSVSNPVAGGTASTLAFTPQLSDSGLQYRAMARSLDGGTFRTATSSVARLTVAHGKVYIGGYRTLSSVKHAGYWRDKTWVSLPELSPANDSQVNVVVLTATDVYAGGYCRNSENLMIPGYWKNGQWIGLVPGNGADTQIKYMSVKEEGAITTIGVIGVPGGSGATAIGNWFWINGVRRGFSGFPYVSFQPKGIEADQDGFAILMAAIDAAGKTVTCAYMEFMGDPSWVISDMPPDYYSITSYAQYQGTFIFAGSLRSAGGQTAGYGRLNQPAWQKMAPDAVGPSNRGFVRSVANHGGNLYAYVYANNIPAQFWVNGTWVQVYQPTSDYAPNGPLFANPEGYYQAGTAGYRAGYWKNNVWTYVGTLADGTTPTCIAAR